MRVRDIFKSKSYQNRIILWITASTTLIVIISTLVIYGTVHKIFLNKEYETNKEILGQMKYNTEFMDKTIANICFYMYTNTDSSFIMNSTSKEIDMNELSVRLGKVAGSAILSNNYIQSICIYNSFDEQYFYTGKPLFFDDIHLKQIMSKYPNVPKLKPILRKIKNDYGTKTNEEEVLTYILYETAGTPSKIDSAIIVNVRPEWLLDNLRIINMPKKSSNSSVYVMNEKGEFIGKQKNDEAEEQWLYAGFNKNKNLSKELTGFFDAKLNGQKCFVTYARIESDGLVLFKVQPVKEIYSYFNIIRNSIFLVLIAFIMIAIIISIFVSRKLYNPIHKLIGQINLNKQDVQYDEANKDEISYLNSVYSNAFDKLSYYEREKSMNHRIMKTYWLRKLITEGEWLDREESESIFKANSLNISYDDYFIICVFKIDNFAKVKLKNSMINMDLIKFAIVNIMSEVISQSFAVESVEMYEDQMVSVVGIKAEQEDYIMELSNKIKKSQEYVLQYFNISVTASVSEMILNFREIPQGYEYALKSSLYRFAMGKMSIIVPEKTKQNISSTKEEYSKKFNKLLVEGIKTSNISDIEVSLKSILEDICELNYDRIMGEIVNLIDVVKSTFDKMIINRNCVGSDLTNLSNNVFKIETIDEFYHLLVKIIEDKLQYKNEDEIQLKYTVIAKQAIDIIINNYSDSNLCTNQIADMMKMNPRRISRIFKDFSGVTIAEQISEVRLKKAAELLENTQISVYEIIEKIGLENESYFYKN